MAHLPPIPGSDEKTLKENDFNHFYYKRPKDFWGKNEIEHTKLPKHNSCDHFFTQRDNQFICNKCNMGLEGEGLTLKKGQLFYGETQIFT